MSNASTWRFLLKLWLSCHPFVSLPQGKHISPIRYLLSFLLYWDSSGTEKLRDGCRSNRLDDKDTHTLFRSISSRKSTQMHTPHAIASWLLEQQPQLLHPLYAISDLQSLPLLRIFPFWMKNIESNHHFPCRQWGPFSIVPHWHYSLESTPQPRRCCHHTPQLASAEYIESKRWVNGGPKWIVPMLTINQFHSSAANPHKLRILQIVLKLKIQISRLVE